MRAVCAICSPEYGRGVSKACHECNSNFKSAMIFLIAVAALFTLIMVVLIAAYLVSGRALRPSVSYIAVLRLVQVPRKCGNLNIELTLLAQV